MEEIWKKVIINGTPTKHYEVSNLGRVKNNKTNRYLYGYIANNGYKMVHLRMEIQNLCSIHRLVVLAFNPLENIELSRTLQINHRDGNKLNNSIDNLEWCSAKENMRHSYENHLQKNESKPLYQYDLNGNFIKKWYNTYEAAETLNLTPSTLYRTAKCGKSKAFGYMWRHFYKEKITPYKRISEKAVYMYNKNKTELLIVFSSQKEAARHIHCCESTMYRYCNGYPQPKNSPYYFTSEPLDI